MKTDTQLQQDVMDELKLEPYVEAAQIGVEVKDGVVTLAGHANSGLEKFNAENAAQRVPGVQALVVEMDVKHPTPGQTNDADLARAVKTTLDWMGDPPTEPIKVMVEHGNVTLTGDVQGQYQQLAAIAEVRHLEGLTGLDDQIVIKPVVSLSAVKSEIETALSRHAKMESVRILVEVQDDSVTLTGSVNSWSERDLVMQSARGTPGVHKVVDHMTLAF